MARLEELRKERDVSRKQLADLMRGADTRQAADAALSGRSTLSTIDAEAFARRLGASVEVVVHDDPVDEFRRALAANDLTEEWRDTIWSAFQNAKARAVTRGTRVGPRPKKVRAG